MLACDHSAVRPDIGRCCAVMNSFTITLTKKEMDNLIEMEQKLGNLFHSFLKLLILVCLGKALSGGLLPVSAVLCDDR
jgi:adenosylmethionine-8-amino-7-oxononanoate aminotransferase